jgi:ABC-type transporter Mla maintaining outer membrane lipid asymmetry permease subunit MlaE
MHQLALVDRVGTGVLGFFESVGALATFGSRAVVEAFRPPYEAREILTHIYQFGYRSAPLILTAGFAIGQLLELLFDDLRAHEWSIAGVLFLGIVILLAKYWPDIWGLRAASTDQSAPDETSSR